MAAPFKIKLSENIKAELEKFGDDARQEFEGNIEDAAKEWADLAAKTAVSKGIFQFGGLVGGIGYTGLGLNWSVVSAARYSPFHEWGTIKRVNVPADQQEYAKDFEGAGIKKTGGIFARPFFFIHKDLVLQNLEKRIFKK